MISKTFDDYTILKLLGKGNMADVYLARQNSLQREVALKMVKLQDSEENVYDDDIMGRFMREARIAGAIQHPNIINIYAVGKVDMFAYIAMEYVDGPTLDNIIATEPLSEEETWELGLQVCYALRAASNKNIIHRDIKPANILIAKDGQVKITDFGLSKRNNDTETELTQHGLILGTPSYMSIEQAAGEKVDLRTDIYSLGVTIYRAITGKLVFHANTIVEVLYKHKYEKAIDPIEHIPNLSYKSSFIIAKMIQKKPEDRYQNYDDIICDIQNLMQGKALTHATEKDTVSAYLEKFVENKIFSKTSRLTQRIVGNVQNIIKRSPKKIKEEDFTENSDDGKDEFVSGSENNKNKNTTLNTTKRNKKEGSSDTSIRKIPQNNNITQRTKITNRYTSRLIVNLEKNIEVLEKRVGKSFSQYLVDTGILTKEQLQKALDIYLSVNSKFGDIATSEGWLLPEQVEKVLKVQRKIKKSFGQLAIQMGFLTKRQVLEILDRQDRHHIDFYEVLMRENFIDKETLEKGLLNFTMS